MFKRYYLLLEALSVSNSFFIFPERTILESWKKSTPTMSSSITGWFWLRQTMHSLQTNHEICEDSAHVQTQYEWARLMSSVQSRGTCTYFCNSTSQKECSYLKYCHAYVASKQHLTCLNAAVHTDLPLADPSHLKQGIPTRNHIQARIY